MTPLPIFSSISGTAFLDYFALFYDCDKLSTEEAALLNVSTRLDSTVSQIQALKDLGNNLFRQQEFGQAGGCYDMACRLLCLSLKDQKELDLNSISLLAVSLCLNLAACANKLQGFEEALIYCSMVLNFFSRNAKALFRKAVALKKLNRFSEALTTLDEASLTEPHNKDIIQEREDVRRSLAINKNGKRVIIDSVDANDVRPGKVLVSPPQRQEVGSPPHCIDADMVELLDEASCASSPLVCPDSIPVTSPKVPVDSKSNFIPNETMNDSKVSQSSPSTNSTSSPLRFTNKKRPYNALNLSSQDYDNLVHGKNLGFYHPRSMSFMRVHTLHSKTIKTGTPHAVYRSAEVPTFSPTTEIPLQPIDVEQTQSFELVQKEAILKVDKKTRLNSFSPYATKFSLVQFKFAAVRDYSLCKAGRRDCLLSRKGRVVNSRSKCRMEYVLASSKTRSLPSAQTSASFCKSTSNTLTFLRMKRKHAYLVEFDAHYHPPFKKNRLVSSVVTTCSVSSVTWFSRSFGVANTPLFVL